MPWDIGKAGLHCTKAAEFHQSVAGDMNPGAGNHRCEGEMNGALHEGVIAMWLQPRKSSGCEKKPPFHFPLLVEECSRERPQRELILSYLIKGNMPVGPPPFKENKAHPPDLAEWVKTGPFVMFWNKNDMISLSFPSVSLCIFIAAYLPH